MQYLCIVTDFSREVYFKTARSGGSGGQNVNKVETMAEACWFVAGSAVFTDEEKALIAAKLDNKINKEGVLAVRCSETRSQLENRQQALAKLEALVARSLTIPKKRKATRPSKAAKERRLESKKRDSEKKVLRRNDFSGM